MKKQIIYYLLFGFIAVLTNCSNESDEILNEEINTQILDAKLYVKDGVLHFENDKAFFDTMEKLRNMSNDKILQWIDSVEFDNSLFYEYMNEEKDLSIEINDNGFLTILNKDYVYAVGNNYRKITEDYQLIVDKNHNISVDQINWSNTSAKKLKIERHTTNPELFTKEKETDKTEPYWGDFLDENGNRVFDTKKLSAHLIAWNTNYGTHSTYGVQIKGRKYKRRKWRDDSMWFASVDATIEYEIIPINLVIASFIPNARRTFTLNDFVSGTHQKTVKVSGGSAVLGVYIHKITVDFVYEDDDRPRVHKDDHVFYDIAWWD